MRASMRSWGRFRRDGSCPMDRLHGRSARPRMARQVGWAMRRCSDALPWQRVVRADGSIAGGGYAALRRALLEGEGIPFTADGRVDMARCAWEIPPQEVHHG